MKSDLVDLPCEKRHETAESFLIYDGTVSRWVPKSLVELAPGDKGGYIATMPEWLAKQKDLI